MNYSTKICLIGDFAVGKTSLIRRFTESRFSDTYLSTIGVRVSRRVVQIADTPPTALTMLIWDTAGSEPFTTIVRSYYRGARGAALVCDLTRSDTAAALERYAQEFLQVNPCVPLLSWQTRSICVLNALFRMRRSHASQRHSMHLSSSQAPKLVKGSKRLSLRLAIRLSEKRGLYESE